MKYTQTDVDLYANACAAANYYANVPGQAFASIDMSKIADSLRPCHYDGPDN